MSFNRVLMAIALVGCLLPAGAVGQDATADDLGGIDEIVVTAEKRESTLQETPIAITAITSDELGIQQIDGLSDVQYRVPSMVYGEIADMAQITLRGVGVDISEMAAEPGVALHADGVYRGGLTSSAQLFFDMERVEVLRGPQGTLYGRNSTGGSINVITKLPGDEPAVELDLLAGSHSRFKTQVAVDLPVNDLLAVRGAFLYDSRDGYRDNAFNGREEDDARTKAARGVAVFTPNEDVEFILRAEWHEGDRGGPPFQLTDDHPVAPLFLSVSNPGGFLTFPQPALGGLSFEQVFGLSLSPPGRFSTDPQNVILDQPTRFERDAFGISGTLTWELERVTFKSITSWFESDQDGTQLENDGSDITYLTDLYRQENEEFSQEINVTGTALDERLDWIVGAFYFDSEINERFDFELPALQASFEAIFGIFGPGGMPLPPGSLAFFGTDLDGNPSAVPFLDFSVDQDLESIAVFAQGTYHIQDDLRATLGLRWTDDEKKVTQTVVNNLGSIPCRDIQLEDDWSEVTGKLAIDYDLSEDTLLYGSVSRGFKAGGFNGGSCNNGYDPELIWSYEAGAKMTLLDRRLQLNVAAFYYDYTDLQARLFIQNASIVQNAADAEVWGVELEWIALVSESFRIEGNVGWLNAEFGDFVTTDPLNPDVGFGCDATGLNCLQDLSGNQMLRAPDFTAFLAGTYTLELGDMGQLALRAEYAYTDDLFHTVFENDFAEQEAYGITNLRVVWTPPSNDFGDFTVQAFVENLSDKDYVAIHAPNATTGGTLSQFAPPRTFGVLVSYRWGGDD